MTESRSATFNACYVALDLPVVRGAADDPALIHDQPDGTRRTFTYAQLLTEVAALGGVLQAFGVGPGDRVTIHLPTGPEAVISMLACARIGALHDVLPTDGPLPADDVRRVVLTQASGGGPQLVADGQGLDWDVAMRAGRTDPAAVVDVAVSDRTSREDAIYAPLLAGMPLVLGSQP